MHFVNVNNRYMDIEFSKYHGTGNDFIMIDGMKDLSIRKYLTTDHIAALCHRRFGIGADGLIILSPDEETDFYMVYYNSDGRISSMCGNGSRCTVRFAHNLSYISEQCTFMAIDGIHHGRVESDYISVHMSDVHVVNANGSDYVLDTGSPHYVTYLDDVDGLDIISHAHKIRYSDSYKSDGINVNFVKRHEDSIQVRTYERGVEDETYSCGTGVVACAIASSRLENGVISPVHINTKGGDLKVSFQREADSYKNIWLAGPAVKVFEGKITI